tara:strand:- start:42 stop:269 length:228 start_codon:yes stop_codon:yes gene_type:complete
MSPELIAIITIGLALGGVIMRSSWWASGLSSHVESIDANIQRCLDEGKENERECKALRSITDDHEVRITVLETIK